MSVRINNEEFKIYLQDSLDTIKERYCLEQNIIPKLCYMKVIKQNNISTVESKKYGGSVISVLKENTYDVNPLEGAEIEAKTFSDFYLESEIDENDFEYTFNKFFVNALELFPFTSRDEVFFSMIIITNSDPLNEDDFSESYERAIESYVELVTKKEEYDEYFKLYKQELDSLKVRVDKHIDQSNKINAIVNDLEIEKPKNIVKTDIKLVEYTYSGNFKYSIDVFDFFRRFETTRICPYIRLGKYHKVLNGIKIVEDEWFENYIENNLEDNDTVIQLYIYGKKGEDMEKTPSISNYYLVQINQLSEERGIFEFSISINVNEQMELTEDEIFERTISYFKLKDVLLTDITLKKEFGKGYFVVKGLDISDELFFDTCLNDSYVNNLIFIDEKYKIQKERGGIRFYVSENNLETSIKCSLIKKVITKSTDIEYIAFPSVINVKDFITVIQITKGSAMNETLKLVSLLEDLLYYIQSKKQDFISYYEKYMTKLGDIDSKSLKKIPKEQKKTTLKDIYPQIFISGYPRFCQPTVPKIIPEDEYTEDIENDTDAMIFPRVPEEGPQDYYSCKHDTKYKYVGVKENSLQNKNQYKFLPCCFEKDQRTSDKLRYKYENFKEDEDESGFKSLIKSKKLLQEGQYGFLPQNIIYTFNIIHEDSITGKSRFLRTGIKRGIDSALYAIKKAKGMDDISIDKMRKKILSSAKYNLSSQYGLTPKYIKKVIDENLNIDPVLFLETLENLFEVNIIIFCRDRIKNKEGTICSPDFKKFLLLNANKKPYPKTIILYKTDGGEFDNIQYPHTELIVLEKQIKVEDNVSNTTLIYDTTEPFISQLYAIFYSYVETKYIKFGLINKIVGQVEDGNGKIRMLYINFNSKIINVITSPCSNFPLSQFSLEEKPIYKQSINPENIEPSYIINFFITEQVKEIRKVVVSNRVVGLYASKGDLEMYVPCDISVNEFSKIPGSTSIKDFISTKELPAPTSLTFSLLNQYNSFLRLSNFIISYSQFLFSHLFQDDLKMLNFKKSQEEFIGGIKDIISKFKTNIIVKQNYDYGDIIRELTLDNKTVIPNNTVIVPSETIKKKILYYLYIQMKYNLPNIIEYKYKKYVDNFYISSKDFKTTESSNIFYTLKEIRLYMNPIVNQYEIHYEIQDELSYYYKNPEIDEETVFRAIKCENIESALYTAYTWDKKKTISLYSSSTISPDTVNFILYEMIDEFKVKEHNFISKNSNIYQVLIANVENEIKIYALLPI
jgi:hypothetical protein